MNKLLMYLGIPLIIVLVVGMYLGGVYNGFVSMSQNIDGQWAQVETQYQRRFDLIPNLVNSVKGVLTQEQTVFGKIADARAHYTGAQSVNEKAAAASELEGALSRLLVIVENYPQLKSNETVQRLMDELAGTENRIAVERSRYNELVKEYNTKVTQVPGRFFVGLFGFAPRNYFQITQGAEQAPQVDLQ